MLSSVQAKVVSVIILVLALAVAGSIYLTVTSQRADFLEETSRSLAVTSGIINDVIRNTMLVGEAPIAVRTMNDLQASGEFEDIAIFRRDGSAAFNDASTIEEVNEFLGGQAFFVTERLPQRRLDNADFQRVLQSNTPRLVETVEDRTTEYYFPILNYSECRTCHGTSEFIRGVAYFRVSTARVYDEIARTRNTLTLFFVGAGVVLALIIILMLRRIVLQPVLRIGETVNDVGQGNLETHVNVDTQDELGRLASEINVMIGGLKEKNRLEVENRVIEAKNEENRKYLDNINEGLLLLDSEHQISEQYSAFLEELFGTSDIAGRQFSEFIYPDETADAELRTELDQFVDLVFTSVTTDMEMISSINPLSDKRLSVRRGESSAEIIVDASFQRIMEGGAVQNVMVIFVDKTELVRAEQALESERLRSETEIEQIAAILRSGPESFQEFARDAEQTLMMLDRNIELTGDAETMGRIFRDLHSLKGAARYMELKSFAHSLNEAEELVASVRDGRMRTGSELTHQMTLKLEELLHGVDSIKSINERFREFASHEAGDRARSGSIRSFFDNIERMASDIADELGKKVRVRTATDFDVLETLPRLRNPIIHIVRNALDHGVEEGLERISKGKTEEGTLEITFNREEDNRCRIEVRDDGRGIDFAGVARRAREAGLIESENPSTNELLKVLFSPAFTSREEATEVSGRGVGLDAVQAAVRALGGSISVATREHVGTRFTLRVPISGEENES